MTAGVALTHAVSTLYSGLGIRSFDLSLFTLSIFAILLSSIFKKEWLLAIRSRRSKKEPPWANRSCCSLKYSDCELIALVALNKRATVSKSLSISLKKNNVSDLLVIQANRLKKTSDSLEKTFFVCFWQFFKKFSPPFLCQKS